MKKNKIYVNIYKTEAIIILPNINKLFNHIFAFSITK